MTRRQWLGVHILFAWIGVAFSGAFTGYHFYHLAIAFWIALAILAGYALELYLIRRHGRDRCTYPLCILPLNHRGEHAKEKD